MNEFWSGEAVVYTHQDGSIRVELKEDPTEVAIFLGNCARERATTFAARYYQHCDDPEMLGT